MQLRRAAARRLDATMRAMDRGEVGVDRVIAASLLEEDLHVFILTSEKPEEYGPRK